MLLKGWIRLDGRTLIRRVPGKLSAREQRRFESRGRLKGEYDYFYSPQTNQTTVRVIEHPEWTGEFARKEEKYEVHR